MYAEKDAANEPAVFLQPSMEAVSNILDDNEESELNSLTQHIRITTALSLRDPKTLRVK